MNKKPNVLFLFVDDQRFDTIRSLGNHEIHTPELDKLVAEGTAFTKAHIPCGTSGAVCMPSRAMLHTGRTLFHLEDEGQEIPKDHTTMGQAFEEGGYYTFGTGKWHNGTSSYARSFMDGANIFFGGMWDHWNVPVCNYDPSGNYDNQINATQNFLYNRHTSKVHADKIEAGKHSTELIAQGSIDFIEGYEGDKPFFAYVSFLAPHDPRTMPDEFKNMYRPEDIELPENYMDYHPIDYGIMDIRDELLAPYPRNPENIKEHIAEYYGMISHIDYEVGRIIKSLEDKGILDDTIIVFAGDNGLAIGQHGLMGKQNLYEHSIRVPLIFKGPGIPKGQIRENYAYLLDIFPTLCELTDTERPASVEGVSLLDTMEDENNESRDSLYFAYTNSLRGVKDDNYKLIEYRYKGIKTRQLFDIRNDKMELRNLYGMKEHEDTLKKLEGLMMDYKASWEDTDHPLTKAFWED